MYCPCFAGILPRFIALPRLFRLMAFKNELCHSRSVLVSAHCFKNELCFLRSVLVLTHRFKNESRCMLGLPVPTLGLKNELCYTCSVLVLTHGTTRLPEIPSESMCFQWIRWTPSDDFPTLLKVLFTLPVSSYD